MEKFLLLSQNEEFLGKLEQRRQSMGKSIADLQGTSENGGQSNCPQATGLRDNQRRDTQIDVVSPSNMTIYTCAIKPKANNGNENETMEFSSPENYNSTSDSSYERYESHNLDYANNLGDDPERGCSNDLGRARHEDLACE